MRREELRTSPRFVPEVRLSMFLADNESRLVYGAVENLSEVGACVLTDTALENGRAFTVNVKNGYSFLFRAEARIVWQSNAWSPHESFDCAHGISFTDLSLFARRLIRRLGGITNTLEEPATELWAADSDPDIQVLSRTDGLPAKVDEDQFDLLTDPSMDALFVDEHLPYQRLKGPEELSGNLGYFDNTDVLQMLEATRATGVLYLDGECGGEIHLLGGKICECFASGAADEETAFRMIVARRGRFSFVRANVQCGFQETRTTTQLVLEAKLRFDEERRNRYSCRRATTGSTREARRAGK